MRIAIDLDDTLLEFVDALAKFHNKEYGTALSRDDFYSYNFWEIWGGSKEESRVKVDYFYANNFRNIKPLPGATEAIAELSKDNELFIITARDENIKELTLEQVHSIFPKAFNEVHFTNSYSLKNNSRSKAEICDELEIDVLIEDSADNANESVSKCRKVFLFNRPWNIKRKVRPDVIRVDSWDEIFENLNLKN